jgi:hypothetical protein
VLLANYNNDALHCLGQADDSRQAHLGVSVSQRTKRKSAKQKRLADLVCLGEKAKKSSNVSTLAKWLWNIMAILVIALAVTATAQHLSMYAGGCDKAPTLQYNQASRGIST